MSIWMANEISFNRSSKLLTYNITTYCGTWKKNISPIWFIIIIVKLMVTKSAMSYNWNHFSEVSTTTHQNSGWLLLLYKWSTQGKAWSCSIMCPHGFINGKSNKVSLIKYRQVNNNQSFLFMVSMFQFLNNNRRVHFDLISA